MIWVENETFIDQQIKLDFTRWKNCKFINCEIILNYGIFDLVGCGFDKPKFSIGSNALAILKALAIAFPTIPMEDSVKDLKWVECALDWINSKNPEAVKKWIYGKMLQSEKEGDKNVYTNS